LQHLDHFPFLILININYTYIIIYFNQNQMLTKIIIFRWLFGWVNVVEMQIFEFELKIVHFSILQYASLTIKLFDN